MSLGGSGSGVWLITVCNTSASSLLVQTAGAAGQQHDDGRQEGHDQSCQQCPDSCSPCSFTSIIHVVDLVAYDAEEGEIGSEDHDGDDEGKSRDDRGGNGTDESAAEGEEECDE